MATLAQLKEGIVLAHRAGNFEHARILADAYHAQAAKEATTAPSEELPDRSIGDIGSDIVTGAAKGITSALQAGVGLADIPAGGAAGKALKPYLDLEKLQEGYSKHYSPQQQAAIKAVEEAKGFGGTLEAYVENPAAALSAIGESIPSMLVGGGIGKGLLAINALKGVATPLVAGALGEGIIGAGSAAESIREQSPDELLSGKGTLAALGAGAGATLFGVGGGKLASSKLAQKFGVVDPDTLMAGGMQAIKAESANAGEEAAKKGFLRSMIGSGISEGVFEEMPQSAQEQMWANFANDRPLTEGVGEAAASGLVVGGAMGAGVGGGFNAFQLPQSAPPPPADNEAPLLPAQPVDNMAPPPPPPPADSLSISAPTVEALTPQAQLIADVNNLKAKSAMVSDWLGANRGALHNALMAQDFTTNEGLDKVEELLGGKESTLGARGLGIAEKDLVALRNAIGVVSQNQQAATLPDQQAATLPDQQAATLPDQQAATLPDQQAATLPDQQAAIEPHPSIASAQSALDAYIAKPNIPANVRAVNEAAATIGITGNLKTKIAGLQNAVAQAQPAQITSDLKDTKFSRSDNTTETEVNNGIQTGTTSRPVIDADRLADLRRKAADIEDPARGITLYITNDGKAILSGPARTKIPARFEKFANENGLEFAVRRRDTLFGGEYGLNSNAKPYYGAPMPNEYREAGALYFGESYGNFDSGEERAAFTHFSRGVGAETVPADVFVTDQSREEFGQKLGAKIDARGRLEQAPNPKLEDAMRWLKGQAKTGAINRRATYRDISMGHALDALDASPNLIIRQIAEKAKARLTDIGFDFNKVLRTANGVHTTYGSGRETITLKGNNYWNEKTLAHEIMHGFAASAIRNPTEAQKPIIKAITALYHAVRNHPSLREGAHSYGEYGIKDVHEFVSEGLSNPEFQYKLSQIKYENTTAWGKFTQLIADLLGVPRNTAFMELVANTEQLIETVNKSKTPHAPVAVPPKGMKPPKGTKPPKVPTEPPKAPAFTPPMGSSLVAPKKTAFQKAVDYIETMLFSSEAALTNSLERSMRQMGMPFVHMKKVMLASSMAQAVHSAYLGMQGAMQGTMKYNPQTYTWEAVEATSIDSIEAKVMQIGVPMEQFQDVMEARRIKEIHDKAAEVLANYEHIKSTDRKKAAAYLNANKKVVQLSKRMATLQMTEGEAGDIIDEAQQQYPALFEKDGPIDMWRQVRDSTIKVMVDSGRYSRNQAEALMEAAAYVPFQRVMEAANPDQVIDSIHKGIAHSLLGGRKQYGIKGSAREVRNIFVNMKQWQTHSFAIGIKNHKALQLVDAAQMYMHEGAVQEVKPGTTGAIMVYRHGKKEYFKFADPLFYHAFNGMQGITTDSLRVGNKFSSMYQNLIVRNPVFTLAQLPQDTYAAMFTSGLKNPIALPLEVVKQFSKTLGGSETEVRKALTKRGITGDTGFNTINAHEWDHLLGVSPKDTALLGVSKWLTHLSEAGDAAVRQAVYVRTMKEMAGLPDAEAIATQRAADIINFRRQGASAISNMLRQTVPFYGAYLQAQRVAIRTLSGRGISPTQRAGALKILATTTAQMIALGMVYAAIAGDDDEFKEMSPQERDNKLLIPGTNLEIPLRRDWTLLPHVIGMHTYTQMFDKGTEDPATAKKAFRDAFLNAAFAIPTPVPMLLKPSVEVAINHNFFTGRPIESQAMEGLDIDEKYSASTSILGRLAGKAGIMSPVNFDHLFKGYTGSLGTGILLATDAALGKAFDFPYTEKNMNDLARAVPGVASIYSKEVHSGDATKFYELLNEVTGAAKTVARKEANEPDTVEKFVEEKGKLFDVGVKKSLAQMRTQLRDITKEERRIANIPNKTMPPAAKRAAIEELKAYRKETLADIQEIRNYVYR